MVSQKMTSGVIESESMGSENGDGRGENGIARPPAARRLWELDGRFDCVSCMNWKKIAQPRLICELAVRCDGKRRARCKQT